MSHTTNSQALFEPIGANPVSSGGRVKMMAIELHGMGIDQDNVVRLMDMKLSQLSGYSMTTAVECAQAGGNNLKFIFQELRAGRIDPKAILGLTQLPKRVSESKRALGF